MTKRAGKRKTGLDVGPELAEALGEKVMRGWSIASAAESLGVHRTTIYQWLAKGEGPEAGEPYKGFADSLKKALGAARGRAEETIYRRAEAWQAAARWLESMDPKTWRRTERREISSQVDFRVAWPDLARPGQAAALRRAEAAEKAIAGDRRCLPDASSKAHR